MRQIFAGLAHIHMMGWAHLDMKPENIVVKNGVDKIVDFGMAQPVRRAADDASGAGAGSAAEETVLCSGHRGTIAYVAPEVVFDDYYDGCSADMYSCGVILYAMLYRENPFRARDGMDGGIGDGTKRTHARAFEPQEKVNFPLDLHTCLHGVTPQLITDLLNVEPKDRPLPMQLLQDNEWLKVKDDDTDPDLEALCLTMKDLSAPGPRAVDDSLFWFEYPRDPLAD